MFSKVILNIQILIALNIICVIYESKQWPKHDISTLKLLQLVHRHGDRAPIVFSPNDPYKLEQRYWPSGIGQLTSNGRSRMYRLGQYIRREYDQFLGQSYSPREVFARSSGSERCLESIQCLLSGAYPPKSYPWIWTNDTNGHQLAQVWQPIPVESYIPKYEDIVLNTDKHCPIVEREMRKIYSTNKVKEFIESNRELYEYLSPIIGQPIDCIKKAKTLHSTLDIEINSGYYWTQVWPKWTEENIVQQLYASHVMSYTLDWDSPLIRRLRAGGLVKELNRNILKFMANRQELGKKLFVYSTHDTLINGLMHALNVFNGHLVPFGSTLMFELHETENNKDLDKYYLKLFYFNDTLNGIPYSIPLRNCQNRIQCPIRQYFDSTKHLIFNDFVNECNEKRI